MDFEKISSTTWGLPWGSTVNRQMQTCHSTGPAWPYRWPSRMTNIACWYAGAWMELGAPVLTRAGAGGLRVGRPRRSTTAATDGLALGRWAPALELCSTYEAGTTVAVMARGLSVGVAGVAILADGAAIPGTASTNATSFGECAEETRQTSENAPTTQGAGFQTWTAGERRASRIRRMRSEVCRMPPTAACAKATPRRRRFFSAKETRHCA